MREIKFRAWDDRDKVMVYEDDFLTASFNPLRVSRKSNRLVLDKIMQFTGLKDKNGKDIYEGDIMNYGGSDNKEVVFMSGAFGVINIEKDGNSFGSYKIGDGLVVGNIYENPDLLS